MEFFCRDYLMVWFRVGKGICFRGYWRSGWNGVTKVLIIF